MADWTDIDPNTLLPGDPFTSAIALALEENPRALAEQAVGAPKIAERTAGGVGGTVTFTGLGDYAGIKIRGGTEEGGALSFAHSTDGVTFSAGDLFAPALGAGNNHQFFELFFDFASGDFKAVDVGGGTSVSVDYTSGTSTGSTLDITDVRVSGGTTITAFAIPQGGEAP